MATLQTNIPTAPREEGELIPADSVLAPYISVDPGRMHGEPCFRGCRVPIQHLFDHLRAGDPLSEFLEGFPSVSRVFDVGGSGVGIVNGMGVKAANGAAA